jgi:hypothetical protein
VLLVPKVDMQCTILVPWEGIALWTILAPLVCHYRVVVGNCLSSKTSSFSISSPFVFKKRVAWSLM